MAATMYGGTIHAAIRAGERIGVSADRNWFGEVRQEILAGRATRVHSTLRSLDDNPVFDVQVQGKTARVVFDPADQVVITVLPSEFPVERRKRLTKQHCKRKREFFRGFQEEGDE